MKEMSGPSGIVVVVVDVLVVDVLVVEVLVVVVGGGLVSLAVPEAIWIELITGGAQIKLLSAAPFRNASRRVISLWSPLDPISSAMPALLCHPTPIEASLRLPEIYTST